MFTCYYRHCRRILYVWRSLTSWGKLRSSGTHSAHYLIQWGSVEFLRNSFYFLSNFKDCGGGLIGIPTFCSITSQMLLRFPSQINMPCLSREGSSCRFHRESSLVYFLFKSAIGKSEKAISHLRLVWVNVSTPDSEDFFPNQEKVDICNQAVTLPTFIFFWQDLILH